MKHAHKKYKYMVSIQWSDEDNAYVVEVPELPGCMTHGSTYEQAAKKASDAITSWIAGAKKSHFPIPEPLALKNFSGRFVTRVDPSLHRSLAMKAKQKGKTMNKFVEELVRSQLAIQV